MTQFDFGVLEITHTGAALATKLNGVVSALMTQHRGPARPAYVQPGMLWLDDSGSLWLLNLFDGTGDIAIAAVDPETHSVVADFVPRGRKLKAGNGLALNGNSGTNEEPAEADLATDLLFNLIFATTAEATAGALTNKPVHPAGLKVAIAALAPKSGFTNVFTAVTSGVWTVPDGITEIAVVLWGGGAGGGCYYGTYMGGYGGRGAMCSHLVSVTPGQEIAYTIGAGGTGSLGSGVWGTAGGSSSVASLGLTAPGGAGGGPAINGGIGQNGANGSPSGGNLTAPTVILSPSEVLGKYRDYDYFAWPALLASHWADLGAGLAKAAAANAGGYWRLAATMAGNHLPAVPDMTNSGAWRPGAGGMGSTQTLYNAGGGCGGAIMIVY